MNPTGGLKGQKAHSPGQRPGYREQAAHALKGQKHGFLNSRTLKAIGAALITYHLSFLTSSCSYSEDLDLCTLTVQLVYPENTIEPYAGARVELKALGHNAVFVDSTDVRGTTRFTVTPGIYEASSTAQFLDSTTATWWRYNFNGVKSMIIVSPDSTNHADITLKSSRKRVIH